MKNLARRDFVKITGLSLAGIIVGGCDNDPKAEPSTKPNILLIMVDDMGFSDLGCYGSEINTPNIDSLAAGGLRYTQFYNAARCCPTRASLMTGQYAHSVGMGWMTASNLGRPAYVGGLNDKCITIAQALKPAGYRNYMVGKWHVVFDKNMTSDGSKHNWPLQRGFDRYFGGLSGGGGYYKPTTLTDGNERIQASEGFYYTDATGDYAVKYLNEHFQKHKDEPFFMYAAFYAPHRPLHAKPEDIAKYKGKYMIGWDELRGRRHEKQLEMGIVEDKWQLSPRDKYVKAWDDIPEKQKALWDMRMATYAAQIDSMDQNLGKILDLLKKNNAFDNTIVMFLSDNGGCSEGAGNGDITIIGTARSDESYRAPWANASDTPFRRYKKDTHEGGIATPLIVHWAKGLKVDKGSIDKKTIGHVIDVMPTCLSLADVEYPDQYAGKKINPLAGESLTPSFKGEPVKERTLYFEHQANCAVRMGKYKLVSKGINKPPYKGNWELYDLEADRTELNDLVTTKPELANKLIKMFDTWAEENGVYPLDNSGWGQKIKASVE